MPDPTVPVSLPAAFLEAVTRSPDKPLMHFEGRTFRYREVHQQVAEVAAALNAWGLGRGDRVALYLENSPSFITAYLGVLWLGGVIVPVNTRYRETELRHMLNDSGARLLITDSVGIAEVDQVRGSLPSVDAVVEVGEGLENDLLVWRAFAKGDAAPTPVALAWEDLAVIAYTSGTTGRSKGAMLSHGNLISSSQAVTRAWGWTAADHLLLALPLFHVHGLAVGLHGTLIQGSSLTLMRKFEAAAVYDELCHGPLTLFFGVPTMYARLLEAAKKRTERPRGLRLLVSGSAPLSPQTLEEVEKAFGLRILERYGMTETVMNLGNPLGGERKAGSVGVPFEGVRVRLVDIATGRPVRQGETGELQLRGPNVFRGYWRDPEGTQSSFTEDGWFKTGDLGYQDGDGYYFLTGRARELIISGGFNVYPREVEEVIEALPGVREAAVLGLPDPDLGERVVAAVVREDPSLDAASIQAYCKEQLASFKKPCAVYFVVALPRNALGKVQKHLLKDQLSRIG